MPKIDRVHAMILMSQRARSRGEHRIAQKWDDEIEAILRRETPPAAITILTAIAAAVCIAIVVLCAARAGVFWGRM